MSRVTVVLGDRSLARYALVDELIKGHQGHVAIEADSASYLKYKSMYKGMYNYSVLDCKYNYNTLAGSLSVGLSPHEDAILEKDSTKLKQCLIVVDSSPVQDAIDLGMIDHLFQVARLSDNLKAILVVDSYHHNLALRNVITRNANTILMRTISWKDRMAIFEDVFVDRRDEEYKTIYEDCCEDDFGSTVDQSTTKWMAIDMSVAPRRFSNCTSTKTHSTKAIE